MLYGFYRAAPNSFCGFSNVFLLHISGENTHKRTKRLVVLGRQHSEQVTYLVFKFGNDQVVEDGFDDGRIELLNDEFDAYAYTLFRRGKTSLY